MTRRCYRAFSGESIPKARNNHLRLQGFQYRSPLADRKQSLVGVAQTPSCLHTMAGPNQVKDIITPPGAWWASWSLSRRCCLQDSPRQSFLEHPGKVAEPK